MEENQESLGSFPYERRIQEWRGRDISLLTKALVSFQGELASIKQDKINPFFKYHFDHNKATSI